VASTSVRRRSGELKQLWPIVAEEQMHGDDMSGDDAAEMDASRSASERDEDE
jgi:hypothetical protein